MENFDCRTSASEHDGIRHYRMASAGALFAFIGLISPSGAHATAPDTWGGHAVGVTRVLTHYTYDRCREALDPACTSDPIDRPVYLRIWFPIDGDPASITLPEAVYTANSPVYPERGTLKTPMHMVSYSPYPLVDSSTGTEVSYVFEADLTDIAAAPTGGWPLVVNSHGSSVDGRHASYLTEAVASHGMVVVGIEHTNIPLSAESLPISQIVPGIFNPDGPMRPDGSVLFQDVVGLEPPSPPSVLRPVEDVETLVENMGSMDCLAVEDDGTLIVDAANNLVPTGACLAGLSAQVDATNVGLMGQSLGQAVHLAATLGVTAFGEPAQAPGCTNCFRENVGALVLVDGQNLASTTDLATLGHSTPTLAIRGTTNWMQPILRSNSPGEPVILASVKNNVDHLAMLLDVCAETRNTLQAMVDGTAKLEDIERFKVFHNQQYLYAGYLNIVDDTFDHCDASIFDFGATDISAHTLDLGFPAAMGPQSQMPRLTLRSEIQRTERWLAVSFIKRHILGDTTQDTNLTQVTANDEDLNVDIQLPTSQN